MWFSLVFDTLATSFPILAGERIKFAMDAWNHVWTRCSHMVAIICVFIRNVPGLYPGLYYAFALTCLVSSLI